MLLLKLKSCCIFWKQIKLKLWPLLTWSMAGNKIFKHKMYSISFISGTKCFSFPYRCHLWLQGSHSSIWLISRIRDEINKSQADKWFTLCWHEYLQYSRAMFNHSTCSHGYCEYRGKTNFIVISHPNDSFCVSIFFSVQASQQDASYAFVALAVIFCCFLSMLLIFVPKVSIFFFLNRNISVNWFFSVHGFMFCT